MARQEYAAIRTLRKKNWIAAHIRERRYELDLTQQEVARRAGTSHSFISKLESGEHIPTIPGAQPHPCGARRATADRHRAQSSRPGARARDRASTGAQKRLTQIAASVSAGGHACLFDYQAIS